MEKIQVEIFGITMSPTAIGSFVLLLKETNGERQLPVIIGPNEAHSIAKEMENLEVERPLTHDLISNIFDELEITVLDVFINELKDGTFFSIIKIEFNGKEFEIDSRPSDAIAIAIRVDAPIYVSEEVLNEAGITSVVEEKENQHILNLRKTITAEKISYSTKLEELKISLSNAIENEDYEEAAKIRDKIKKLTHSS